jgi:hypothetical protein
VTDVEHLDPFDRDDAIEEFVGIPSERHNVDPRSLDKRATTLGLSLDSGHDLPDANLNRGGYFVSE